MLRHYARARTHLTGGRARCWQRLGKLLEDALIKVWAVASTLGTKPVRNMLHALIAGERDPQVPAGLARGQMKATHAALAGALAGAFADHHGELAQLLLDQITFPDERISQLPARISAQLATIRQARGTGADATTGPHAGTGPPRRAARRRPPR